MGTGAVTDDRRGTGVGGWWERRDGRKIRLSVSLETFERR
jgi:hypothetical protein